MRRDARSDDDTTRDRRSVLLRHRETTRLTRSIFPVAPSAVCISSANRPFLFCFSGKCYDSSAKRSAKPLPPPPSSPPPMAASSLFVLVRAAPRNSPFCGPVPGSAPSSFPHCYTPSPSSGVYIFLSASALPSSASLTILQPGRGCCFLPALLKVWPQPAGKFTFQLIGCHGERRLTANYLAIIH